MAESSSLVLLVEDDPLVLESTAETLAAGGFRVLRASSCGEAMALLEQGPTPTALVTDIHLASDGSGLDLARTVLQRWPEVRVLLVSGEVRPPREDYPDSAIFFTKPYADGALLSVVSGTAC